MLVCVLLVGAVLRATALGAYRPALLTADSASYLQISLDLQPDTIHPAGYPAFLKLVRLLTSNTSLTVVPLLQHLLGLGAAVALYLLQVRLGVRRGLAAAAVVPLLLDAYWLNLEQHVMSETLTLALLVAACTALLWRRPVSVPAAAAAALALAAAAMTRTIVVLILVPAAVTVLALATPGSRGRSLAVFLVAAMLPLAGYATWFHVHTGRYALSGQSARYLYGRVATFVDCSKLRVPSEERPLCPKEPVDDRWHPYYYVWFDASPFNRMRKSGRDVLAGRFNRRAILNQPVAYVRTVGGDVIRGFALTRTTARPGEALWRWQFQSHHPVFARNREPPYMSAVLCGTTQPGTAVSDICTLKHKEWAEFIQPFGDSELTVQPTLARWLTGYREVAYVPGPLLAIALALGAVGAIVAARRRETRLWTACFLMTAVPAILLAGPIATLHFAWRYAILAFVLVPVCGALGITAVKRTATRRQPPGSTVPPCPLSPALPPRPRPPSLPGA